MDYKVNDYVYFAQHLSYRENVKSGHTPLFLAGGIIEKINTEEKKDSVFPMIVEIDRIFLSESSIYKKGIKLIFHGGNDMFMSKNPVEVYDQLTTYLRGQYLKSVNELTMTHMKDEELLLNCGFVGIKSEIVDGK